MITLIVDTREQTPYDFASYDAEVVVSGLIAGDYSIQGFESVVAVERKSLNDLMGCLIGYSRDRFERELERLRAFECAAVVVESPMADISNGTYRSNMNPHAALQSILTFQVRYGVPFVWAGTRTGGEYCTHWLLAKYEREFGLRYKAAV